MLEAYGVTIFCDDVRYEIAGKQSFIGVYNSEMTVFGQAPATLPMLCAVINLIIPNSLPVEKAVLQLKSKSEDDDEVILMEGDIELPADRIPVNDGRVTSLRLNLAMPNFQVIKDTTIFSRAYIDDKEVKLGSIAIKIAPPESFSSHIGGDVNP